MSRQSQFKQAAAAKAGDDEHRRIIAKATGTYAEKVDANKAGQYQDWQAVRRHTAAIKDYVLDHLPDLLETLDRKLTERGTQVHWAVDAEQAREIIGSIASRREARKVVKSKSMTTEEIGLNEFLEKQGIEVLESDLGELIVQLAGEKPYHIVTPCMHKTKEDIARLFRETLDAPETDSAEELTMIAREHLRQAYVTSDIGISGVNFLAAEDGAIVMIENEGNGRLSMSCPPVHIAVAGIEKVIPSLQDLSLFLPVLATCGTGQQLTCYASMVRGPKQRDEIDGPEEMHLILLDNGRTDLYAEPEFRSALRCIRCGACLNNCPVYNTIGGHAYGTCYQGPIGSVITPHLRGLEEFQHLSHASSLCGACTSACPADIPLHHHLLRTRVVADEKHLNDVTWRLLLRLWAQGVKTRGRLDLGRSLLRISEPAVMLPLPEAMRNRLPSVAAKSFGKLWREHERERNDPGQTA